VISFIFSLSLVSTFSYGSNLPDQCECVVVQYGYLSHRFCTLKKGLNICFYPHFIFYLIKYSDLSCCTNKRMQVRNSIYKNVCTLPLEIRLPLNIVPSSTSTIIDLDVSKRSGMYPENFTN
jgi:hypothetical protein